MAKYIPFLDTLRAISVLIVLGRHFGVSEYIPGGFGVTIFFFISGFLITTLLIKEEQKNGSVNVRAFYMRRIWRLIPPLLLMLVVCVPIYVVTYPDDISWSQISFAFFYAANFHNIAVDYLGWQDGIKSFRILWSLAVEEHFYLFFPLLLTMVRSYDLRLSIVISGCVIAIFLRLLTWLMLDSASSFNYHFTLTRMDSILYGVAFGLVFSQKKGEFRLDGIRSAVCLVAGITVLLAALLHRNEFFQTVIKFSIQGLGLYLIFLVLFSQNNIRIYFEKLDLIFLRFLGKVSYEMYLWHFPIFHLTSQWFCGFSHVIVALVVTIGWSWVANLMVIWGTNRVRSS